MKRIVIISCHTPKGWYKDKIGKSYKVTGENDLRSPYYTIVKNKKKLAKADCRNLTTLEDLLNKIQKDY